MTTWLTGPPDVEWEGEPEITEGLLRLEVRLLGPAREVETSIGTREERDTLVDLRLPVTYLGWRFVQHLVNEYAKPTAVIRTEAKP